MADRERTGETFEQLSQEVERDLDYDYYGDDGCNECGLLFCECYIRSRQQGITLSQLFKMSLKEKSWRR